MDTMARMNARKNIDWEAIERDYRAGLKTLRQIAEEHGITHGAVNKRAKAEGWARDLHAKIMAKAEEKVSKALVSAEVSKESKITEKQIVDAGAEAILQIRLGHRKDIAKARNITMSLFAELEAICGVENAELLSQLGELMRNPDENGQDKLNDLYRKLISLPGRAKTMKDLGDSLKTMIGLEREAFGIDQKGGAPGEGAGDRPMSDAELAVRLFAIFGEKQERAQ